MVDLKTNTFNALTSQQQIEVIGQLEQIVITLIGKEETKKLKRRSASPEIPTIKTEIN